MNRFTFLKNLVGVAALPTASMASPTPVAADAERLRRELIAAWTMSEKMSLTTVGQMPATDYTFKYTNEAMTYAQQWRHCCQFTLQQLMGRLEINDSEAQQPLPELMTKPEVIAAVKKMYAYVRKTIETLPDAKLLEQGDYMGDQIPNWRMLYALENHIIHHRGQCMVYLRLRGVSPEGYLGW